MAIGEAEIKFLDKPLEADTTTDIIYMMCPMHLLTLQQKIKELKVGQVLAILTDYDGALEDIPAWCNKTGNEFLGIKEEPDHYKFYVKKLNDA
ncbi:MAG: sulfurtransferase TusA family protein [Nitrospirae bacterium]|nr:sulfurtransferase TusA family protein [Nitrospirota bacterium]